MGATISVCGRYRYCLDRKWGKGNGVLFIMLNPSTADASIDDRTITRCIAYAKAWGYDRLLVGNLFAFRSTKPDVLYTTTAPIGPENDTYLEALCTQASLIVAAWGNKGELFNRGTEVRKWAAKNGFELHHLKLSRGGHPCHPLYSKGSLKPQLWPTQSELN